jgi:O-antigen/teichoic acid export membrane protein
MTPYIIHGVGQEVYGMYLLVMSLQLILAYIDGGIGPSANRYFGLYAGRGDVRSSTRLLCSLITIVAAANAVLFTIVFIAAPRIVAFFPGSAVDPEGAVLLFRVMIVIVALAQVRGLFSQILFVQHRFGIYSAAELAGFAAYAAGMIWTVETGAGLTGMAWAFVGQQVLHTIVALPAAIRLLSWRDAGFVPKSLLIEFFHYSWKIQASNLLTMVNAQGDMVVVGRLASSQMTAFGTGANFASTLRDIPLNAQFPMQAHVVRTVGARGNDGARAEIDQMQRIWVRVVVGWIAVGAPAALFGVNAWLALGTDLPGIVAAIMLAAHGAVMLVMVQRQWAEALGYSGVPLRYDLLNTTLNLVLTVTLVLTFGVLGTVVATLAAAGVAAIYLSFLSRRLPVRLQSPWRTAPWLLGIACSALSLGMTWAVYTFVVGHLVPNGALSLLVVGLSAAPAFLLYMLAALGVKQLRGLTKQIRRAR